MVSVKEVCFKYSREFSVKTIYHQINGETKLTGIIGYPLIYTLSPKIQNAAFINAGLNWCYVPLRIENKNLPDAVRGLKALGFKGVNVTMPYKEVVLEYMDEITSYAKMVNAVNTIFLVEEKLVGYNTDGAGFLASIQKNTDFDLKDKAALIIGAGGAAKSVVISLASAGVRKIIILNRTFEKAQIIEKLLKENFKDVETKIFDSTSNLEKVISETDIIVNTTPIGMSLKVNESPVPVEYISSRHFVYDLIYRPKETFLLNQAKKRGAKTLNGISMLIYQGAESFKIWTGIYPQIDSMLKAIND
jgi:shikimate dehydrogenase